MKTTIKLPSAFLLPWFFFTITFSSQCLAQEPVAIDDKNTRIGIYVNPSYALSSRREIQFGLECGIGTKVNLRLGINSRFVKDKDLNLVDCTEETFIRNYEWHCHTTHKEGLAGIFSPSSSTCKDFPSAQKVPIVTQWAIKDYASVIFGVKLYDKSRSHSSWHPLFLEFGAIGGHRSYKKYDVQDGYISKSRGIISQHTEYSGDFFSSSSTTHYTYSFDEYHLCNVSTSENEEFFFTPYLCPGARFEFNNKLTFEFGSMLFYGKKLNQLEKDKSLLLDCYIQFGMWF